APEAYNVRFRPATATPTFTARGGPAFTKAGSSQPPQSVISALGETPLIAAVRQGRLPAVEDLLRLGAEVDVDEKDRFGETALMEAASRGLLAMCQLLLSAGANPIYRAPSGLTPANLAAEHARLGPLFEDVEYWRESYLRQLCGQHEFAKVASFLQRYDGGLRLADTDAEGTTALHACASKPPESLAAQQVAKLLIDAGAPLNAVNLLGETPLILATRCSADTAAMDVRLGVTEVLLAAGANINMSDAVLHETALMEAAGIGDPELVLLLLEARADHGRCSASGQTAADFAREPDVVRILENPERALRMRALRASQEAPKHPVSAKAKPSAAPEAWRFFPIPNPPPFAQTKMPSASSAAAASQARFDDAWRSSNSNPSPASPPPQPKPKPRKFTPTERIQTVLDRYPGFVAQGLEVPSDAWDWTVEELELFIGSLGQLWPHRRKRPSTSGFSGASTAPKAKRPGVSIPPPSVLRPHYEALGVPQGTKERQVLKKAYRQAALRWHPDKNQGDPQAAERFQSALNAFEFLCKAFGLD
ncbi:unnamed protein product, partial [Polarella glacialis]